MKEDLFILRLQLTLFLITIVAISTPSSAQWIKKASGLRTRSEVTSVVYNSRIYTFLGFGNWELKPQTSSEVYDPVTDTWKLLASIPSDAAMTHQGVALIDNTVWHIGGRVGKNPGPLTSDIWIYNITTNSWYRGPKLKDPATGNPILWAAGGAVLLGRTLHIVGGFINNGCNNDQSTYHLTLDVDTWLADTTKPAKWMNNLAPLPVKRNHFSTITLGGKIYAIGGQFGHDCGGGLDKQYAHVYNPPTDTWTRLPDLPAPRSHIEGGAFAIDGKIFIVAGQGDSSKSINKVTIFDPAGKNGAGTWKNDLSLTLLKSYEGVSAKVVNNIFIYSHGGEGSSQNTRRATYSRTIFRNPIYKLGFSTGCLNLIADSGTSVKGKTLLFTIDGSKNYATSSNAAWLTVSKNATGTATQNAVDIKLTANTKGLTPGNYRAIVTATGLGSGPAFTKASYCINLTVKGRPEITSTKEAIFSSVKDSISAPGSIVISNIGEGPLNISRLSLMGTNANSFSLSNPPSTPFSIAPGQSDTVNVVFNPSSSTIGALSAVLTITTNDIDEGIVSVGLYGLSANGKQGNLEPPLDEIVETLGYKINVGGTGLVLGTGTTAIGDEVLEPLFQKAGDGPLTIKAVARYSADELLDFGFYTKNKGIAVLNKTGTIALNQEQTLNPALLPESTISFDPGNKTFGFYAGATRNTFTEDTLNTGPVRHAVRIYPLKNRSGDSIINSYLLAFESGSNGDYQDHVFEVTNLKPALRLPSSGTLEAEEAILYGTEVSSDNPGFTGTGFADYINMSGDYIEWNVNEQLSGAVMLRFKYANGDTTDRPLKLEVNGVEVASNLSFPATGAWTNWSSVPVTVNLKAGVNTVRLSAIGYSGPNVDHLTYGNDTTVLPAKKLVTEKTTIPKTSGLIKAYVSPNPASGNVKLVLNALSQLPVEMEVIDMLGKTYRKMKFFRGNSNSFDFSVKDLATGIYIIKIKQGNNFGTAKLMIDNKSIK